MHDVLLLTFADENAVFKGQRYTVEDKGIVFLQNVGTQKPEN
jgi:hypothetical protein